MNTHISTILLVDDQEKNLLALEEILEGFDICILKTTSGEEALKISKRKELALILLDVQMPKMDGYETAQLLRGLEETQNIPIIFVTAINKEEQHVFKGYEVGAVDYLFKPIDSYTLKSKVKVFLELYQKHDQLRQAHQQLKETQTQLIQFEKMVVLGQLTAGIAHEINNPLTFITSNFNILNQSLLNLFGLIEAYQAHKRNPQNEEQLQKIDRLENKINIPYLTANLPLLNKDTKEGLERINQLVLALDNFSRFDEVEQKQVNLIEGIETTLRLLTFQIKNRIEMIKKYDKIPKIMCNISQLNQVFMNVLANAIQAIEEKGTITIQVSEKENQILIEIMDTGRGIPQEVLPHIFEPFYTTKEVGKGTGLGLSISLGIIEKHQGEISFTSRVGQGTTCSIKLPG